MWLSAGLLLSGLVVEMLSPAANPVPPLDLASFLKEMIHGRFLSGQGLLYAGVVTLIFTPVLRVCTAIVAFLAERDWNFVGISIVVLGALLLEVFYFLQ
jgi:uncharacterized membrane protein